MPELTDVAPVKAEPLEAFLAAQGPGLAKLLAQEEQWARLHVPTYPALPSALAFSSDGAAPAQLRQRFIAALRLNPESRLALFLQLPPGQAAKGRPTLPWANVTTLKRDEAGRTLTFIALHDGDAAPVLDVLATASDEPDYGLDIGLWEDSGTVQGKAYGMGKQPFGNPALEFSSQAPLHMGFFHESAIVYKAAPFLQRTYPEYRIHLYRTLAEYALRTGHPYWGWRFAGWALHYVQDLTQPYHARVLPGVGVARMLWINAVDLAGVHGPKERAISLVSNRHLALENYQLHRITDASLRHDASDAALQALRDRSRDAQAVYSDAAPRESVTKESHALSDALDATLQAHLPARYIDDPAYVFGETEPDVDLYRVLESAPAASRQAMTTTLARLLANFGRHSRSFVRSLLTDRR